MESKKNILIASITSWHLRDWAESGFLEDLMNTSNNNRVISK